MTDCLRTNVRNVDQRRIASAGYCAYLWTQMLADDAFGCFQEHGGLTRTNGDRFRQMVLSRGNTEDLAKMYVPGAAAPPTSTR